MAAKTFVDLFAQRVRQTPVGVAMMRSDGSDWQPSSWADLDEQSDQLAHGLISLGVAQDERVGILSRSRPKWWVADLAIQKAAACTVPIHVDAVIDHVQHILKESGTRVILVQDEQQLAKIRRIGDQTGITHAVLMEGEGQATGEESFEKLLAAGRAHKAEFPGTLADRKAQIQATSLASIVYTAGTTGLPKGVMLTHDNFVFEAEALALVMAEIINEGDIHLLCLPLSHILSRVMLLASVTVGYANAFSSSLDALKDELASVQPSFVTVVPGILERIHASLQGQVEKKSWWARRAFKMAVAVGEQVARAHEQELPVPVGLSMRHGLLRKAALAPAIRARLGDRLKFFVSGGAPLSPDIAEFFHSLGLLVLEGYGMTENVGAANVNRYSRYRFGTVGPPIPGVEERLADDGEILIRGRNVMAGYYLQPEASKKALDADGWLHTGDIGRFEGDGFLRVTGRKKDLIVTSGAKNVSPQNIEKLMRSSPYIDKLMVCGDGRKYLTALVSLDMQQIQDFAKDQGIIFDDTAELAVHPRVRRLIEAEIEERNRQLAGYETLRRFAILPEPLSRAAGEITPTMKIRRREVEERYLDLIDAMYAESAERADEMFLGEK